MKTSLDPIAKYMSSYVKTVECSTSLAEAREAMARAGVHHLIVVERGRCVGLLSERDIFRWQSLKPICPEILSVGVAMSPDVYFVAPEAALGNVALEMARLGVGSAVVVADEKPVGIFTTTDALRVLSLWALQRNAPGRHACC